MKKLLTILSVLNLVTSQAQYFQNKNGILGSVYLHDGENVIDGGQGHLLAGSTLVLNNSDLLLTRTDVNGTIVGVNTFNQIYRLTTTSGGNLAASPCKILQINGGQIFVVGQYSDPSYSIERGIFTAILSSGGNVLDVKAWVVVSPAPATDTYALSACRGLDTNKSEIFITGYTDATVGTGNGGRPVIMAIDGQKNRLIWANIYDFLGPGILDKVFANDIIASPYITSNGEELLVVGGHTEFISGVNDGIMFRVKAATGKPTSPMTTYNTGGADQFSAVCIAPGFGGGSNGFVITGSTTVGSNWDVLIFKTDPTASTVVWNSQRNYSANGVNYGSSIISRQNSLGKWIYYVGGTAVNGLQGGSDMVMYMVDDSTGDALIEITYGTSENEYCDKISAFYNAPAEGITLYGTSTGILQGSPYNEYFVKSYFNGVSGCNEVTTSGITIHHPCILTDYPISTTGDFKPINLLATVMSSGTITVLCFNLTLTNGSNLRQAEVIESISYPASFFPNPVTLSNPTLNLSLNSPTEQQIEIRITDMLGREVLNQQLVVAEGETLQQIQLPSGISAGVYNMSISGNNVSENHRFVIE
ncbi:MAG: T9SS type A sorting domain-containing protein [Bacteroidota bacterium]|jgi:hypothetical protein